MLLALISLAFSGFLSSTILPGSSEAAFIAFLMYYKPYFLSGLIVVSISNTLGSYTSFLIGRFIPNNKTQSEKAINLIKKYGAPLLFFSFLPVVGDLLPIAGGWLRISLWKSLFFIFLGKFIRYIILLIVTININ